MPFDDEAIVGPVLINETGEAFMAAEVGGQVHLWHPDGAGWMTPPRAPSEVTFMYRQPLRRQFWKALDVLFEACDKGDDNETD